uniref:Uncharacterized protein n=1 Tax=Ditylenchus dipsaci TaxID=166011 RepID=A0A915EJ22_9BILA
MFLVEKESIQKKFAKNFAASHRGFTNSPLLYDFSNAKSRELPNHRARVNPVEALRQARRPQYLRRDANLKALTQGYQTANRIEFLRAVQHHLSKSPLSEMEPKTMKPEMENLMKKKIFKELLILHCLLNLVVVIDEFVVANLFENKL